MSKFVCSVLAVFVAFLGSADIATAQSGLRSPVYKAGPYTTAVGPGRYRLKLVVIKMNPATMTTVTQSFEGGTGFPELTIQQSITWPPMNFSYYTHRLDGAVTNQDALVAYNSADVMMVQGIVQYSADGTTGWIDSGTATFDHDNLPPVNE